MKLFDALKQADVIRLHRELVIGIDWYAPLGDYAAAAELSSPDRMGIATTLFEDQDITLENGFAQVANVEGDTVTLEFLKTSPLE